MGACPLAQIEVGQGLHGATALIVGQSGAGQGGGEMFRLQENLIPFLIIRYLEKSQMETCRFFENFSMPLYLPC